MGRRSREASNTELMMASEDDGIGPRKRRKIGPPRSAPYVLRQLLDEVPLSAEDGTTDVHITCVEYWSKGQIRHVILYVYLTVRG